MTLILHKSICVNFPWTMIFLSLGEHSRFLYITSFQDESRLEEAKKVILMVVVGVALVGGSYAIVSRAF